MSDNASVTATFEDFESAETILEEAQRLTHGPRQHDYSHPYDDYTRVVGAFNALTGHNLTAHEGALLMCCIKLAREAHRPKRDNRVDLAGYAWVMDAILERTEGA